MINLYKAVFFALLAVTCKAGYGQKQSSLMIAQSVVDNFRDKLQSYDVSETSLFEENHTLVLYKRFADSLGDWHGLV